MDSENGSGSNNHSTTQPDMVDGSGNSKHLRTNPGEVDDGSGSSKHPATHPEANVDERGQPSPAKKLMSSSSASSSSSDDSMKDFFQLSKNDIIKPNVAITVSPKPDDTSMEDLFQINKSEAADSRAAVIVSPKPDDTSMEDLFQLNKSEVTESSTDVTVSPKPDDTSVEDLFHLNKSEVTASRVGVTVSPKPDDTSVEGWFQFDKNEVTKSKAANTVSPKPDDTSFRDSFQLNKNEVTESRAGITVPPKPEDTSFEDFFQLNKNEVMESKKGIIVSPKADEDSQPAKGGHEINVSSKLEEPDTGSNGPPSSQVSGITQESVLVHGLSPTQFPPIQAMERSGEESPYRIPSSVFARSKSITPMEWSVASNESLFSIHVGNNSFSKDHLFMLGKSGELIKSGELLMFSPSTPITVAEPDIKSTDERKINFGAAGVAAYEPIKEDSKEATVDDRLSEEKSPPPVVSWRSSSVSHHSNESGTSTRSFAFPILTEGVRSSSVNAEAEQQQQHLHTPNSKVTSKSTTKKWFPYFSWCPRCYCC